LNSFVTRSKEKLYESEVEMCGVRKRGKGEVCSN
jgi:hypothetical protein